MPEHERPVGCTMADRQLVIRRIWDHPRRKRLPDAVARPALIRDEVGVVAVLDFVPIGFEMPCR